jgi:hypothetical protein
VTAGVAGGGAAAATGGGAGGGLEGRTTCDRGAPRPGLLTGRSAGGGDSATELALEDPRIKLGSTGRPLPCGTSLREVVVAVAVPSGAAICCTGAATVAAAAGGGA